MERKKELQKVFWLYLQKLQKEEALFCFGEHYKNVLEDENGTSHQNIRNFMKSGFEGLSFDGEALVLKS